MSEAGSIMGGSRATKGGGSGGGGTRESELFGVKFRFMESRMGVIVGVLMSLTSKRVTLLLSPLLLAAFISPGLILPSVANNLTSPP